MKFRPVWLLLLLAPTLLLPGCTNLFAKNAIEKFSESLQAQDLEKLKGTTSAEFEQKALRQADSAQGLKVLKIPAGEVEIVSVEDLPDGKRKAIVKVGKKDKAQELEYRLSRVGKSTRWVVDDVILKQDSGSAGVVQRSVTEQMDLLLTSRELVSAWKEGTREEKLAACGDELGQELGKLPPVWLNKLSKEIVGTGKVGAFRPVARMNGDRAIVEIPRPGGVLLLDMRQTSDRWSLHDMSVEEKSADASGIRSLSKMIKALSRSSQFLEAYAASDRAGLESTTTPDFYNQCLSAADLSEAPIPVAELLDTEYETRQFTDGTATMKRMELLLKHDAVTYMLTLNMENSAENEAKKDQKGTTGSEEVRITEVTLFEKNDTEVKRLSSLFLSQAVMTHYVAALRERDLQKLKELSSSHFNERAWGRQEASLFRIMADPEVAEGEPEIVSTSFRGDVTEITILQGNTPMTLVMNSVRGWMVVDDVLFPTDPNQRPSSLKETLDAQLTIHAFASAIHRGDLNALVVQSADGMDRMVWKQVPEVPELARQLARPLMGELLVLKSKDSWATVCTSDGVNVAEVQLMREGKKWVVHDVALVATGDPVQRVEFLSSMRQSIATAQRNHQRSSSNVALANHEESAETEEVEAQPVRQTGFTPRPEEEELPEFEPIDPALYAAP